MPAAESLPSRSVIATYQNRIDTLRGTEKSLQSRHVRLGWLRLVFGVALVVCLLPPRWYALLPLIAFIVAAQVHQGVLRRLAETRRVLAFYEHGLARVEDRWTGLRPRQTRASLAESLYAEDLDIFGSGSLFELLCEARTTLGEDTLAAWLLQPAAVETISERQQAVAELRGRLPLREAFAAAAGPAVAPVERESLLAWAEAPAVRLPAMFVWLAPLLVVLTLGAAWRYAVAHTPLLLVVALLIDGSLTFAYRGVFRVLFTQAEQASRSFRTVAALLRALEGEAFLATSLAAHQCSLRRSGVPASIALARLARLVTWAEARGNYIVRILDTPFLYSLQLGLALEHWRRRHGQHLRLWLDSLGEMDAMLSLAGYSFEHPDDPFPRIADQPGSFMARALGHPLLPASQCVRNDVSLGQGTQMLLISGSNMSGKSTLLRSVGINAVLAFAGAPVRARELSLSPFRIAASIQVSDSLQAGRSRFYAEILRLRAIAEASHTGPVLFLIDELLAGTNSSDRLAGAEGLVRELLRSGAIGMLSTHDLALTSVTAANSRIHNVHFEDQVVDGQLRFDYTLRDGVVERSNGLALMRLIGLQV